MRRASKGVVDSAAGGGCRESRFLLRVGLLVGSPRTGGTERQVAYLAEGLEAAGHVVTVFFMSPKSDSGVPSVSFGSVRCVYLGLSRWNRLVPSLRLWWLLRKCRLDVLHMFNLEAMEFAESVAGWAGVPVRVGSVRGIRFASDLPYRQRMTAVLPRVAAVTVNSEATAALLVQHGLCAADRISHILNGVRVDLPAGRCSDGGLRILFAGSLKGVKNPACFVEACLRVLERGIDCRIRIAGDGPLRAELENMVARSGRAEKFDFLGNLPPEQVPYSEADIVVSTSWREAASNTLLEAMAHGVAIVGTDSGGTAELMRKGEFGMLVAPGDAGAVAEAIQRLASDPELRARLGRNGAAYVREHLSISAMVQRHASLYEALRRSAA